MQANRIASRAPTSTQTHGDDAGTVLVLSGYGLRVSVSRRHLHLSDGVGRVRRTLRLHRATTKLRRLVVIGHTGYITLEALRWLGDVGASFSQIDSDGRLIASFSPRGTQDVRLRRVQAQIAGTGAAMDVVRMLLQRKVAGQLNVLCAAAGSSPRSALETIQESARRLPSAASLEELSWLEARAASAYWTSLAELPVRFPAAELRNVPAHWLEVGPRASPLTGRAHNAGTPAHACLNYLYAILENEARVALMSAGLDPEMGLLHTDRRFRSSFALDILEPVRPDVDTFLFELLRTQVLSRRDFVETRLGVCRLGSDIARRFAQTAPTWAARVSVVVRDVLRLLEAAEADGERPGPAKAIGKPPKGIGKGALHRRTISNDAQQVDSRPEPVCEDCGTEVRRGTRRCRGCARTQKVKWAGQLGVLSAAATARRRAAGVSVRMTPMVAARRAAKITANQHAAREWRKGTPRRGADRERFRSEVLPRIRDLPLRTIADATGVSVTWWSLVKRGVKVPQERHWPVLLDLAAKSSNAATRDL